jgi:selenocysteine lyase/cysteine desulfurase
MTTALSLADVAACFPGARGYLNSATCGLPSLGTLAALDQHLSQWRDGGADLVAWDEPVRRSRSLFGALMGVAPDAVSVGSQVAITAATVAASLAPGTRVALASGDFTSLTWPFLSRPDLVCTQVDVAEVPSVDADWVVASVVQSADGRVLDLSALGGRRTLLDATQSAGWLPTDASRFDVVTAGGYKWLSCPRGTAFTTWSLQALAEIAPLAPNWYAADDVMSGFYLDEVSLAADARRHDVSPAWPCWAGTAPALDLIASVGVDAIHAHNLRLAGRVRAELGLAPSDSAIVSCAGDAGSLAAAGISACARAGRVRLSFHLYNDDADVDRVLEVLA